MERQFGNQSTKQYYPNIHFFASAAGFAKKSLYIEYRTPENRDTKEYIRTVPRSSIGDEFFKTTNRNL